MLHQVGVSFDLYYDARKHKIKILSPYFLAHTFLRQKKSFLSRALDLAEEVEEWLLDTKEGRNVSRNRHSHNMECLFFPKSVIEADHSG